MTDRIVINGQEFDSVDAMPEDVRRLYEDALRLARDSFAGRSAGSGVKPGTVQTKTSVRTTIFVNGKEYHSADELPPDVRATYERAIGKGTPGRAAPPGMTAGQQRAMPALGSAAGGAERRQQRVRNAVALAFGVLALLWLLLSGALHP